MRGNLQITCYHRRSGHRPTCYLRVASRRLVVHDSSGRRMNPIDQLFTRLKTDRRKAFIPFITAGDPDLETTAKLLREAARRGASLIEVGFPYSDPIADGSVIQASYTRALSRGVTIDAIFGAMRTLNEIKVPLVAMV